MTQQLSPNQLRWLRNNLRLGDNYIYRDMGRTKDRIKREEKETRTVQAARSP